MENQNDQNPKKPVREIRSQLSQRDQDLDEEAVERHSQFLREREERDRLVKESANQLIDDDEMVDTEEARQEEAYEQYGAPHKPTKEETDNEKELQENPLYKKADPGFLR